MDSIFDILAIIFTAFLLIFVIAGQAHEIKQLKTQLEDKQIELNVCNSTMNLFDSDFDRFCAERFEKMGC